MADYGMGKSEDILKLKRWHCLGYWWLMIAGFVREGQTANRLNARIMFRFCSNFKGIWTRISARLGVVVQSKPQVLSQTQGLACFPYDFHQVILPRTSPESGWTSWIRILELEELPDCAPSLSFNTEAREAALPFLDAVAGCLEVGRVAQTLS